MEEQAPSQPWVHQSSKNAGDEAARRHAKRATLNLPINIQSQLANKLQLDTSSPTLGSTDKNNNGPASSTIPSSSAMPTPSRLSATTTSALCEPPDDGFGFLTALAAQERKVLELKEELQRAEIELTALKKQWESNEKIRKRTEVIHHAEAMKPLKQTQKIASIETFSASGVSTTKALLSEASASPSIEIRNGREMEQSYSLRPSTTISTTSNGNTPATSTHSVSSKGRTVFQGSRHARTLSLLTSVNGNGVNSSSSRTQDSSQERRQSSGTRTSGYPRSATLPSSDREPFSELRKPTVNLAKHKLVEDTKSYWRRSLPPIAQDATTEAFVRTGKRMANDFKDGLFTFLDDIRQATVGDEGINGTESRLPGSKSPQGARSPSEMPSRNGGSKARASNNLLDVSFWSEFGMEEPENPSKSDELIDNIEGKGKDKASSEQNVLDVADGWDAWDTPQPAIKHHSPSSSSSTFPSKRDHSPSTSVSSPRSSTSLSDFKLAEQEHAELQQQSNEGKSENKGSIPWPVLNNLTPSKLSRTASNLMAEWERSISPPTESESKNRWSKAQKDD